MRLKDSSPPQDSDRVPMVLVAEDEPAIRRLLETVLERDGFRVLIAGTGLEALDVSREYEGSIDLLVTDLVMPGMSGTELAEHLRAERPGVKVIYISGYAERPDALRESRSKLPPTDTRFIHKPFSPERLSAQLYELLRGEPAGDTQLTGS